MAKFFAEFEVTWYKIADFHKIFRDDTDAHCRKLRTMTMICTFCRKYFKVSPNALDERIGINNGDIGQGFLQ